MAEGGLWLLIEDGSLNVETDSRSILYHPNLNIILVITNSSEVHVIDVNSGVILLRSSLSASSSGFLRGTYLAGQDKVLFTDGDAIGVRSDYNGVLLLDTILQTPISKSDEEIKLELLMSEAVLLQHSLQTLQLPGVDQSHEVIEELTKKIEKGQVLPKKGTKAVKWNTLCLELPYSALKPVAVGAMQELKRQSGIVPALPVASAITERLNCLLPEPRLVSGSMAGNGQDRSAADRALMFSEAARRGTFGKWPHMNYKWALPDQMAQAGFYHQPSSTGDDRAMCFTCNVCLVCWEPTDEPWSEHERHSPSCPFVKGEYTQNVPLSVTLATSPAIPLRERCPRKNRPSTNTPPVVLGTSSVSGLVATATIDADPAIPPLINIWNVSGRLKKETSYRVVNPINLQLAVDSGGQSVSLKSEGAETKESMLTRDAIPSTDLPPDVENLENSASNVSSGDQSLNESVLRMNLTALSIVGVSCRQNRSVSSVSEAQNTVQRALIVGFSPQKSSDSSANQTPRTSAFPFSQLVVYDLQHLSCNQDPGNMSGSVSSVTGQRREGARPEKDRSVGSSGTRQENSITAPIFPKILGSEGTSKELVDGVDSIPLKLESFISDYGGLHMQQPHELSDLMYEEMSGLGDSEASAEGTPETKRPQAWAKGNSSTSSDTNWPTFVQCVPLPVEHEGSAVWGLYPTFDGGYVLVVTTNFSGGCRLLLYPLEWSGEGLRLWEFPVDAKELYGEGLNPVEVNMLPPESEDRENLVSGVPRGFVSLICEDGILRVIELAEMKVVSIAKPEKGKVFVSATYCNSLERLCACTNKGSLHFFVLPGEEEGESVREEEEEQFGKSWEVGEESMESSPSSPSPSPLPSSATPLLVHKSPLTLSDLQQLHLLTQFENLVPCYAATVPPCWLEMMQAQKQRRHPQHLQRGDEVQHTRSWRLLQDGTTWDEHVFEITLPRSCCVGHVDVKFSLHPANLTPPNIEITLLKQNASGIGRKGKKCLPAVDDGINFNINLNDSGVRSPTENPVTSEAYLKAHNTEILCGPVNIVSCLDLTNEGGTVTLTSPKLFQIRGRTLLVHIKAVPDKENVFRRNSEEGAVGRRSRGGEGSKSKDASSERLRYIPTVDRISSVGKSVEGYRGCDWLHEISITIRKTKATEIPKERAQRNAMLTSNSFLYKLLDSICEEYSDPVESLAVPPLALDILIWVVSIRLSHHSFGDKENQLEVIKAVQSRLETLVYCCLILSGRSIAHKFVKLILICSEGYWNLKESVGMNGSRFDTSVLHALISGLMNLKQCHSAGALRWLFSLMGRMAGPDGMVLVGQHCVSLLLKVAQEINLNTNIYHLLLRSRYGLYGLPLEPEQFDADPPPPAGFSSSPVTYATVAGTGGVDVGTANGTGGGGVNSVQPGGMDGPKTWPVQTESMDLGELLMEGANAMGNSANMKPKGIAGHVRGLLEVVPLHFHCHATSDGTRLERMEPPVHVPGMSLENLFDYGTFDSIVPGRENVDVEMGEESGDGGEEDVCTSKEEAKIPVWHRHLSLPPPQQVLVIERMHSGARRFAVLEFGGPILLTDLIIPACSDLVSLSVDIWTVGEEVDGQRLVVASDIGSRSLVMNDLQPPPICKFVKITVIGRYGMSTTRCKIPVGFFYGHIVGDSFLEKNDSDVLTEEKIKAQLAVLSLLFDDIHCRYSLACARLQDLLDPILASEAPNVVHMHSYLQMKKDNERGSPPSDETKKVTSAYQECVSFQHQLNLVRSVVRRLESTLGIYPDDRPLHTFTDKLRVLAECLLDTLLGLTHEFGPGPKLPAAFYKLFDERLCETLFQCLCVTEDGRMQLATSHLLMKMCGMQPWWGEFLAQTLTKLYSSRQTFVFPMDRVFMLIMHLGRKSVTLGDMGVLHSVLRDLGSLLAPFCAPLNGSQPGLFLGAETDLPLVSWLLLFLSFCLDSVSGSSQTATGEAANADDGSRSKYRDQGVPSRWDFIQGDIAMQKKMASSGKSNYSKCYRRKLQKRLMHHKQQLDDLEATKKAFNPSQALANISSKLGAALKQHEKFFKKNFSQQALEQFKSLFPTQQGEGQGQPSGRRSWWPGEARSRNRGERGATAVEPDALDRGPRISLPRSTCLPVTRGLVAFILRADITSNTDTFILACKVLARIVLSTRPAISLGELMTREQLLHLIQMAVCNDQHCATWGGPWTSHAVSCLLQDILDAVRLYPTSVNREMGPMEEVPESSSSTADKAPANAEASSTSQAPGSPSASTSTVNGNGGDVAGFGGEEEPVEVTLDAGMKEKMLSSFGFVDTDDSELEEYMDDLLERGRSHIRKGTNNVSPTTSSISTAVDARLECGVDGNAEIMLRKMTYFGFYNQPLISTPLQPPPELMKQGLSDAWGRSPSSSQWEDVDVNAPCGIDMVTYCFDKIFTDLPTPVSHLFNNSFTNLEMVLQLWLSLNQDNCDITTRVGSLSAFDPTICPSVSLSHSAISGLISALTWNPNVTLRTWCLAFRCLTLAANLPISPDMAVMGLATMNGLQDTERSGAQGARCPSNGDPLEEALVGMASAIVRDRNFVPMLIRFLSGAGESGHSNDGMAGPSVCHALHGLLLRLQMRTDVVGVSSRLGAYFKSLLLDVVYRLVCSPVGAILSRRGPLDAQLELLAVLVRLDFKGVDLCTATSITESVALLVHSYVMGLERVNCQSLTSSLSNASVPSLMAFVNGQEGGSRARLPPPPSWNTLICVLLRLVTVLVQTPLSSQNRNGQSSSRGEDLEGDSHLEDRQGKDGPAVAQTDEDKAERQQQSGIDGHSDRDKSTRQPPDVKVPCVADTVLQHEPTMVRLLGVLAGCGGFLPIAEPCSCTFSSDCLEHRKSRFAGSSPPGGERSSTAESFSVADCVYRLLLELAQKATTPTLVLGPLLRFLSPSVPPLQHLLSQQRSASDGGREDGSRTRCALNSVEHLVSVSGVVQLSEPLLALIRYVLSTEEAISQFNQMGGIGVICENLVRSNRAMISIHPGLVSVITRHLGRTIPIPLPRKPGGPPDSFEGLQNFAPIGTITSSSPTAHPADVLIQSAPLHRRARTPAWAYTYYPEEAWVELTISLPCAILLKVVELQPHLPSLATCPSAVAIEVSRDGGPPAPVCPPLPTGGLAFIRLVLPRPEVASSVLLRLYRPRDASNMALSQIRLLGSTAYGGEPQPSSLHNPFASSALPPQPPHISSAGSILSGTINTQNSFDAASAGEDRFPRSCIVWLCLLEQCLLLPKMDSKLSQDIARAAAAVPGLPETCCGLLLVPPRGRPGASLPYEILGPYLQKVLLHLGLFSFNIAQAQVNLLLSNGAAAAFGNAGALGAPPSGARDSSTGGVRRDDAMDSILELLFNLCSYYNRNWDVIKPLLSWLQNEAMQALGVAGSEAVGNWVAPPAKYVHCVAAILWYIHQDVCDIAHAITPELFSLLHEWTLTLSVPSALKRALDWVLCSMCYIQPNLFPTLMKPSESTVTHLSSQSEEGNTYESSADSATDDLKEREREVSGGERLSTRLSLTMLERRLCTLASACQSPAATTELLASGLPSALARGILEFCKARQKSEDIGQEKKRFGNMDQIREGVAGSREWPLSQSTLTDADKAKGQNDNNGREGNNHLLTDGLGEFQVDTMTIVLNFFAEVCSEGRMRNWLGSTEGSTFWFPLLNLLCNSPGPNGSLDRCELATEAYSALESATVKFFARCCWCHSANQQLFSNVLCEVIRRGKTVKQGVWYLHGISGFTRRLILQLLLESERLVVFVKEMDADSEERITTGNSNYGLPGGALPHPQYGVGKNQRNLLYLSTQTTIGDILGLVTVPRNNNNISAAEGRGNPNLGIRNTCQSNGPPKEMVDMDLSMIAGLTAKDKRVKDAKNDATAASTSASAVSPPPGTLPVPLRGGTGASRTAESSSRDGPFLYHGALSFPLPRELSLAHLLAALQQRGYTKGEPRITLWIDKSPTAAEEEIERKIGRKGEAKVRKEEAKVRKEEAKARKLLEVKALPSPLLVFTQQGGLALLAHHLPLIRPDALLRLSPPDTRIMSGGQSSQQQPPSPPDGIDTEWVKVEANEDIYEELDEPILIFGGNNSPGMAPGGSMVPPQQATQTNPPPPPSCRGAVQPQSSRPSVPAHSLAAFRIFLRLPGYAEALLKERLRARCLLRLLLGVVDDGEGGDILSSPLAPSLPTLPFEVLRRLLNSTPLSTDDGVLLRRRAVESGAVHLLLACLSAFTHHNPVSSSNQTSNAQISSQVAAGSSQEAFVAPKVKNGSTMTDMGRPPSDDKSHLYWAKGTGFGTGSTTQSWNVEQALLRQKSEEEHVTVLLMVLSSFINPGGMVPSDFFSDEENSSSGDEESKHGLQREKSSDPPLPPEFHDLLLGSCLLPAISSYLRNDSVLDMARHIPLYRAVLQLLRALALSPRLVCLLLPQETSRTKSYAGGSIGSDGLALVCLLTKMKNCVDTYASRLRTNKIKGYWKLRSTVKYSEDAEQDEGLALLIPDIQQTAHLVQVATDRLVMEDDEGVNSNNTGTNNLELPLRKSIEERYLEVMKKLQFDSFEIITESEEGFQFVVPFHFEPSLRAAGERCHPSRMRRLAQEAVTLSTSLPLSFSSSVFVRCDMDRLDVMKVLITGPAETPYANGCFEFDVYFPPEYPNAPMNINLETTGHHMVRFNPNLYNDGKVCLSVLNTWHGRPEEKWNASTSSFLQVLVSIQSLIFVPEPYFNEPGYERSRGSPSGNQSSREYNANICQATVKWAMLEQIRNPCPCFKEVIHTHFWIKRHEVIRQIEGWLSEMEKLSSDGRTGRAISLHTVALKRHFRLLKEELAKLKPPSGLEDLADSPLELSSPSSLSALSPADSVPSGALQTNASLPANPQTPEEVDAEMEKMVSKVCE